VAIAVRLAEIGAAPAHVPPVLSGLDDDVADGVDDPELDASFELVQALNDAYLAYPASVAPRNVPLSGGPAGALNLRGAEAAVRVLRRLAFALRR